MVPFVGYLADLHQLVGIEVCIVYKEDLLALVLYPEDEFLFVRH